jgi:exonuclease VII small subunit
VIRNYPRGTLQALEEATVRTLTFVFLLVLFTPAMAQMGVDEAYQAIPHRRTPFLASQASMSSADAAFLQKLFSYTDRAMVLRVSTLQDFQSGDFSGLNSYQRESDELLRQLSTLRTAQNSLKQARDLIAAAMKDQQKYFQAWSRQSNKKFEPGHPLVRSSSAKLRQAYSTLMSLYPQQTQEVRNAFFDHLCALDFL